MPAPLPTAMAADHRAAGHREQPAIAVCAPIRTLWPTWIWLSEARPLPARCRPCAPRSMLVLAPISQSSPTITAAQLRFFDPAAMSIHGDAETVGMSTAPGWHHTRLPSRTRVTRVTCATGTNRRRLRNPRRWSRSRGRCWHGADRLRAPPSERRAARHARNARLAEDRPPHWDGCRPCARALCSTGRRSWRTRRKGSRASRAQRRARIGIVRAHQATTLCARLGQRWPR